MADDKPTTPRPFPWPLVAVILAIAVVVLAVRPRPAPERLAAAVAEGGTVHAILFCAKATPAERGGIDASKMIDVLELPEFPFDASPAIVVSLTPDRGDRRYKLVTTTQSGYENTTEIILSGAGAQSHIVRPATIRFEGADVLTCRVLADGKVIAERSLAVRPTAG